MTNQIIGKSMFHGYAGSYSRQPDTIIDTHPAGGAIASAQVLFTDRTALAALRQRVTLRRLSLASLSVRSRAQPTT